jgi:uncharacterized iron-regulated protein
MKFQFMFYFCFLSLVSALEAQDQSANESPAPAVRIEDCRKHVDVDLQQLASDLANSDVIFLGEKHDNDAGHEFQLRVIKELVKNGNSIAVSTEQFERDVQGSVDDYLLGRIDEDQFLKTSRPWKNYQQHYRPIVEFAKENKIPVLAANIPRRIANDVAAGKEIALADKPFVPRYSTAPKNAYRQKFDATMKGHLGADGEEKLEKFYLSQCLKDDAMAETITDFMAKNSHQPKIVVHLCGHFHSDYGLGTAARVVQRNPLARIAVVTMEFPSADKKKDHAKVRDRAHYIFWSTKNPTKESKTAGK